MELLGFDLETTSNMPSTARVVQAAALSRIDGVQSAVVNQYCNPGCDISDGAQEVHGISSDMVKDAEPDSITMKRIYAYIEERKDKIIVCGHNIIGFDLEILWALGGPRLPILWIDTLVAATRVFPDAESHKLSDLTQWLGLGSHEKAHDAEADIGMVFDILEYIRKGLGKSYEEMAAWCMTPRILKRAHFGKHKGKLWGKAQRGESANKYVPGGYVHFICGKWTEATPDMVATIKHHYGMRFRLIKRKA